MGAVIDERGSTGREPWTSASFCGDSTGFGLAMSGVAYYGSAADPTGADGICRVLAGGWLAGKSFTYKGSISYFRALNTYYEQAGFFSLGIRSLPFVRLSVEATGSRFGVRLPGNPAHTTGQVGLSAWVPFTGAALSLRAEHIGIATAHAEGADNPFALKCGFHTFNNRFGGQGVLLSITPSEPLPVCFTIGESYRFGRSVAFEAALSNNPLLISAGLSISLDHTGFGIALVNHPVLGWSQGFAAEWKKK